MTHRAGMVEQHSFTPVRPLLQRKCACGGAGTECEECGKKSRLLQRSAANSAQPASVPSLVHRTLHSPGIPLDSGTRSFMESRFGHSFAHVRVHHDSTAAESARAVNAHAYTVGKDIVFASSRYSPDTHEGRKLLAHELAHVVQQHQADHGAPLSDLRIAPGGTNPLEAEAEAASTLVERRGAPALPLQPRGIAIQRQEAGDEKKAPATAATGAPPPNYQVQIDPTIQAQAMALQTKNLLDPSNVRLSLSKLDLDSMLTAPPPWMTLGPSRPKPDDLVPREAGPPVPRLATACDVVSALMKIPAVDSALTTLQTDATSRLKSDWRSLSTGEKAGVVTQMVAIGGAALAGILSNAETRQFALDILQDKKLPTGIPGLNFQFSTAGADYNIRFHLNLGHFLPKQWGFY